MARSRFFKAVSPRRHSDTGSDVQRGLQAGQQVGKLLSGLGAAIQSARRDALANQLMTGQAISEQPGAGQTIDLGKLGGDGGDGGGGGPQDIGTLPADQTFSNPASGSIEPLQDQGDFTLPDSTGSGRTINDLGDAVAQARLADNWQLPSASGPIPSTGEGTVGGLLHTGGEQEMDLRKKMLEQQLQKIQGARAAAAEADKEAERQGTGRFALDAATKRLQMAKLQAEVNKLNRPEKPDKNAPPENIDSEPVRDTSQLGDYVDNQYGNGTYSSLVGAASSSVNSDTDLAQVSDEPGGTDAQGNPTPGKPRPLFQTNEDGTPKYNADGTRAVTPGAFVPVPVGGKDASGNQKMVNMSLKEAQTYIRQTNLQRLTQGLPAFRVPGEEQDVGLTADKPFIAHNNLEIYSRAPGTYVRLPDGRVVIARGPKRIKRQ